MSFKTGLSIFMFLSSLPALAGNWSGGGGELIADANNPWFLENTKTVKYCIAMDETNMSASREKVESIVSKAIAYWKKDFKEADTWKLYNNGVLLPLKVATQDFQLVNCDNSPDLSFQFGFLTSKQFEVVRSPTKYLGFAYRTDYDLVNLRGKGYIYISPDKGPLKYEDSNELVENAWSYDGLLHKVLVHELGHVFGLPHSNREHEIMGQTFPENILSKDKFQHFKDLNSISSQLNVRLRENAYSFVYTKKTSGKFPL